MKRPDHVPPGDWAATVVFCKPVSKTKRISPQEEEDGETFWVLRSYKVFNVDQVKGTTLDHLRVGNESCEPAEIEQRFERAEQVIAACGAEIRWGGDSAHYSPTGDYIRMPRREQFGIPEYYETLFHEVAHWTEHPTRLNWDRSLPGNSYALGELRAELAGCYLAGETGVPILEALDNHAAYIRHWLAAMKANPKFIFKATSLASKAVDYVLGFSRDLTEEPSQELELVA